MSAVWKSEYEKLLDLVTALLATHDPGVAWTLVGEHFLETHFDAEVFTVNTVSAASGTSQVPHSTPSWVAERVPPPTALHQLFSNHPLVVHLQNAPHPMATRRSSDAIAMSTWLNSETHSQLQATLGISHQLAIPLPRRDGAMRTVVLMRPGHDFNDRDLEVATHLQRLLVVLDANLSHVRAIPDCVTRGNEANDSIGELPLTAREITVLRLLANGLTAESMARRLGVSKRTVHKHLEHLYAKLEESDRLSAVLHAERLGIIPVPRA